VESRLVAHMPVGNEEGGVVCVSVGEGMRQG